MKSAAEFLQTADRALNAAIGEKYAPDPEEPERLVLVFGIDELGLSYGRNALIAAARAAARAAYHHERALNAIKRDARLRSALNDVITAIHAIHRDANLTSATSAGFGYAETCQKQLDAMPLPPQTGKGSPGRVVQAVAAEAAARVYRCATGRKIPRSGKAAADHSLQILLRALGAELFGNANSLSVSILRNSKEIIAKHGIPVSRPTRK